MSDGAVARLRALFSDALATNGTISLHEPTLGDKEREYVLDCLDSGWVSSVGAYVDRFESALAEAFGVRHAVATVNGTAAIHLALHAKDVRPGDLVVCPALTFAGTANAIAACHADPLFVDSEPQSLGLDVPALADTLKRDTERVGPDVFHKLSGRRISAIVPVHIFGHPVDMDPLLALASEFDLAVIEDAAEAIGSCYRNRKCGSLAPLAATSFNGNKTVTTGGGGAVLTDDETLAVRLRHLATTARLPHQWEFDHDEPAFNYRLPNINAALGCAQLEQLSSFIEAKRALADIYFDMLDGVDELSVWREQSWAQSNYWLNAVFLPDRAKRDRFLQETNDVGIITRPCWRLLPETTAWRDAHVAGNLDQARSIVDRLVNLPSSPFLVP
jgi:perosamine synthetase